MLRTRSKPTKAQLIFYKHATSQDPRLSKGTFLVVSPNSVAIIAARRKETYVVYIINNLRSKNLAC